MLRSGQPTSRRARANICIQWRAIILRAIDALENYIHRKSQETSRLDRHIRHSDAFNHRQKALLAHGLRCREERRKAPISPSGVPSTLLYRKTNAFNAIDRVAAATLRCTARWVRKPPPPARQDHGGVFSC
ncbi:MAG: hypothetical protein WC231_06955 [Dehalococcoidales bacterium]